MRPLKFQLAVQQIWLFFMISMPWTCAFRETNGDKTCSEILTGSTYPNAERLHKLLTKIQYNLKIGFDLTRGAQGAPSLRIRNFDENEEAENFQPALRAELPTSSSNSNEDKKSEKKKEVPKVAVEMKAAEESVQSDNSDDSDGDEKRSTKGLRADEYEPQGPEVREDIDEDSESSNSN